MTAAAQVAAETLLDLTNAQVAEQVIAPEIASRLQAIIPEFAEKALTTVRAILGAYRTLGAMSTAGAIGAAYGAATTAIAMLNGRVDAAYDESRKRAEKAREDFVRDNYRIGEFASVIRAGGPSPGSLDLKGSANQYATPHVVWRMKRAVGSDVLLPTWSTPPYDEPGTPPDLWQEGWPPASPMPQWTPLSGIERTDGIFSRVWHDSQPHAGPIPAKYRDKYWGTGALWANKYDTVLWSANTGGHAPPPDYAYLFSWLTYPYMSWSSASNGNPEHPRYDMSAAAAAIHAALHSFTPIHAAVDSTEVAVAYRHWLAMTQLRSLPQLPKGQVTAGVYLDGDGLPWAPSELEMIWLVQSAPVGYCNNKPWSTQNTGGCVPGQCTRPDGWCYAGKMHWRVVRHIEEMFRSFFAVRRAALYQLPLTGAPFIEAAKQSRDPHLRAAALHGKLPPLKPWQRRDPLGDGWASKPAPGFGFGDAPPPPAPADWAAPQVSASQNSDAAGPVIIAGAAAAAWWLWQRRR